jgi:predicted nucleic acid-binding protein
MPPSRAPSGTTLARISFRDALIVASAQEADADELLSEDFNAGQSIVGIMVVNPLNGGRMGSEVHEGR